MGMEGTALVAVESGFERHQGHGTPASFVTSTTTSGALLKVCKASTDPNIYTAVMLALATGARAANIRNLTYGCRFRPMDASLPAHEDRATTIRSARWSCTSSTGAHFERDPLNEGGCLRVSATTRRQILTVRGAQYAGPPDWSAIGIVVFTIYGTRPRAPDDAWRIARRSRRSTWASHVGLGQTLFTKVANTFARP